MLLNINILENNFFIHLRLQIKLHTVAECLIFFSPLRHLWLYKLKLVATGRRSNQISFNIRFKRGRRGLRNFAVFLLLYVGVGVVTLHGRNSHSRYPLQLLSLSLLQVWRQSLMMNTIMDIHLSCTTAVQTVTILSTLLIYSPGPRNVICPINKVSYEYF